MRNLLIAQLCLIAACAGGPVSDTPDDQQAGVIASLDLGDSHTVELRSSRAGFLTLVERIPADVPGMHLATPDGFDPNTDSLAELFDGLARGELDGATLAVLRDLDAAQARSSDVGVTASALLGDNPPPIRIVDYNEDPENGDFEWFKNSVFPVAYPRIFETGLHGRHTETQTWCMTSGVIFNESYEMDDVQLFLNFTKSCGWPDFCTETPPLLEQVNANRRQVVATRTWESENPCTEFHYTGQGTHWGWGLKFDQIPTPNF